MLLYKFKSNLQDQPNLYFSLCLIPQTLKPDPLKTSLSLLKLPLLLPHLYHLFQKTTLTTYFNKCLLNPISKLNNTKKNWSGWEKKNTKDQIRLEMNLLRISVSQKILICSKNKLTTFHQNALIKRKFFTYQILWKTPWEDECHHQSWQQYWSRKSEP